MDIPWIPASHLSAGHTSCDLSVCPTPCPPSLNTALDLVETIQVGRIEFTENLANDRVTGQTNVYQGPSADHLEQITGLLINLQILGCTSDIPNQNLEVGFKKLHW